MVLEELEIDERMQKKSNLIKKIQEGDGKTNILNLLILEWHHNDFL